jgi:hypothetical protein
MTARERAEQVSAEWRKNITLGNFNGRELSNAIERALTEHTAALTAALEAAERRHAVTEKDACLWASRAHAAEQEARENDARAEAAERRVGEAVAAERAAWVETLRNHFPMGVECDHENKRDRCQCACALWHAEWHPTYSAAVKAWIDHVAGVRATDVSGS